MDEGNDKKDKGKILKVIIQILIIISFFSMIFGLMISSKGYTMEYVLCVWIWIISSIIIISCVLLASLYIPKAISKRFKIVVSIMIILVILTTFVIAFFNDDCPTKYEYKISFKPDLTNQSYVLEVPFLIPERSTDTIKNFDDKFISGIEIIEGEPFNITLENSNHGKTLRIEAEGNISIRSIIEAYDDKEYIFSTIGENPDSFTHDNYYWIYYSSSNNNNANITISYFWGDKDYNGQGLIENKLNPNGWKMVPGDEWETNTD